MLLGEVTGIELKDKAVILTRGRITYDYLILASGARHSYFGRDEWAPFAPGLKSIEDATAMRAFSSDVTWAISKSPALL